MRASGLSGRRTRRRAAAETREGDGVDRDRRTRPDRRRQQAGQRRPDDPADVEEGLEDGVGAGDLAAPHEARHGRREGRQPEDPQHVHGEGDEEDEGQRRPAQPDRDGDQGRQDGPPEVGQEHHLAPVPAIGVGAGRQADHQVRERREDADDAHREARPGQGEHEDRQGRVRDRVAERADALPQQDDPEVAVAGQRGLGDQRRAARPRAPGGGALPRRRRGPARRPGRCPRASTSSPAKSTLSTAGTRSGLARRPPGHPRPSRRGSPRGRPAGRGCCPGIRGLLDDGGAGILVAGEERANRQAMGGTRRGGRHERRQLGRLRRTTGGGQPPGRRRRSRTGSRAHREPGRRTHRGPARRPARRPGSRPARAPAARRR